MSSKPMTFDVFIKQFYTQDKTGITHTRIGNTKDKIYPGSYNIPDDKLSEFYKLYYEKVFIKGQSEYFTECQIKNDTQDIDQVSGPILVDLDFRYSSSVTNRKHDEDHIVDIIHCYIQQIESMFDMDDGDSIKVFVFEKDNVNKFSDDVTKDGIHIVFGISVSCIVQEMIREKVLDEIYKVFDTLPLMNTYENVIDDGIAKGYTNWQLYGSKKPGNQAYKLKSSYEFSYVKEDTQFEMNDYEYKVSADTIHEISARNTCYKKYTLRSEYVDEYKRKLDGKRSKENRNISNVVENNVHEVLGEDSVIEKANNYKGILDIIQAGKTTEELKRGIEEWLEGLPPDYYRFKEIHYYTMSLPPEYYDDFNKWIRVGWALRNLSFNMFLTWIYFSMQSSKFMITDVLGYFDQWKEFKSDSSGLTEKSIIWWVRQDNKEGYDKVREKTVDYMIEQTIPKNSKAPATEWDVANVVFHYFKDEFRCASVKNNIWYYFDRNRWVPNEKGTKLRYQVSNRISRLYTAKAEYYGRLSVSLTDEDKEKKERYLKHAGVLCTISSNLKSTSYKQNIMKELAELFYEMESEFFKKLDQNPNLLCFTNGVYDFKDNIFRIGRPDDYISISTGIKYVPLKNSKKQNETKDEINDFMNKLFPDENLRTYMWEHLASILIGVNKSQTFNIYNGCGRNGKSKLTELMTKILGEYVGVVPVSIITTKRGGVGSLSPEIAQLKGKRLAIMQEPSKNDRLNDGVLKSLTGGDLIQANPKYMDPIEFMPQFKIVVCTNNLFVIVSNDDGTWRRIRLCNFVSKFIENPSEDEKKFEFQIDYDIDQKFNEWKEVFMAMLVNIASRTQGKVMDCDIVMEASKSYRRDQDYLMQFVKAKLIEKTVDEMDSAVGMRKIQSRELANEFKSWYEENHGKNVPKTKELTSFLEKNYGDRWMYHFKILYDYGEEDEEELLI